MYVKFCTFLWLVTYFPAWWRPTDLHKEKILGYEVIESVHKPQIWNLSPEQTCAGDVTLVNLTLCILIKGKILPAIVWDSKTHYERGFHEQSPGNDCSYQIKKQWDLRFLCYHVSFILGGGLPIAYSLLFPWSIYVSSRVPKNSRCWKQILAVKC